MSLKCKIMLQNIKLCLYNLTENIVMLLINFSIKSMEYNNPAPASDVD